MDIKAYTLAPDQVHRALEAGGPLLEMQVDPARMKDMSVAVVEVDGQIVAYWVIWYALHVEPLWIQEAWRKHPGVVGGIVKQMQSVVEETMEPSAFCVIEEENLDRVAPYADRLGFLQAPAKLYYLVLQPAPEPAMR